MLAAASRGIEHDANADAASLCRDDRVDQRRVGKHEHLYLQRSACASDGGQDWLGGVVREDNQPARHAISLSVRWL
jgi:hypothetical protein